MDVEQDVTRLAIMAAGQVGNDERGWLTRIATLTPLIAAMFRPPQPGHECDATTPLVTARKVLDASVFRGEFVSIDESELSKSHRLIVKFRSETTDTKDAESDGTEALRTEPSWTRAGWAMQRLLRSLEPGQPVVVYKHNDPIDGGRRNVRVLVHLELVGKPRSSQAQPSASAVRQSDEHRAEPQREAPAPRAGGSPQHAAIHERVERLTNTKKVAFSRLCRGHGIDNFMEPADDQLDRVLVFLGQIETGSST